MNDLSIDPDFRCPICLDPFDDAVSTPCDHTFCRECIETSIKYNRACPICRLRSLSNNNLKPANRIILNEVDRYIVICLMCNQTNIIRGDFQEHANKLCSKANVSCPAANIRCPWTGPRDELKSHQLLCLYEQLRPILNELLSANEKMQEQINMQATQLKSIQQGQTTQRTKIRRKHTARITRWKNEHATESRRMSQEIDQQTRTRSRDLRRTPIPEYESDSGASNK